MSPRLADEDANRVRGRVKLPENFLADKTGGSSYEHFHNHIGERPAIVVRLVLEFASFSLTARRIDMGNTFCALRRPATHFLREAELLHTSSQTPSIGPLGACDEVCSSSCGTGEISLQTIEVLPMCVLKVLPMSMRATHPNPLPQGEGETFGRDLVRSGLVVVCLRNKRQRSGDCNRNLRIFQHRAEALPLPEGEGWGEGERSKLQPQAHDDSRNCQTSRVPAGRVSQF